MNAENSTPATTAPTPTQPSAPRKKTNGKRKRNLIILTTIFLLIALGFLLMYLLVWQHEEGTDDAYVNGHLVQVTPQIAGTVQAVNVDDTQGVKSNQVLVTLDDSDMQLAYERAQSELINAIRQNQQQTAASSQAQAQVIAQKAQLARLQSDLKRRESLAGTDAISAEELSHARAAVVEAQAALEATQAQDKAAKAVIGNNVALRQQPAVLTAISHLKDAWLNLQRTQIKAPMDGQVAKRNVQVGQKVAPGSALMAVVPLHNVWVDANFKEGQLANMRIGQPATVTADVYGSKVKYHGRVAGLSAGTGSAFALLPAQNATGNWIKVVQRLPVRIELDAKELAEHPLRVGLSMDVEVNTQNKNGKDMTNVGEPNKGDKLADVDWAPVNTIIDKIFAQYAQ